jgi:MFS transporter, BCD family, chlorophyll transporter
MSVSQGLGWLGIIRLGLVQTALGGIVVLTTSTLNRVMVVELSLPAMLPGFLVGLHYALQLMRPRWGFSADRGGKITPIIIIGMAVLALGGALAAAATALMASQFLAGFALSVFAFILIGFGVGASGTSLLVLLSRSVSAERRIAAATIVWLMMIAGFAVTAGLSSKFLDPFSYQRLVMVGCAVSGIAFIVACVAVAGVENSVVSQAVPATEPQTRQRFSEALAQVWREPDARQLAIFIFISMLAFSAQDLILEPYAALIFAMTPGQTTALSSAQNGGVFAGMVLVAVLATAGKRRFGSPAGWTVFGCLASGFALLFILLGGMAGPGYPIRPSIFALGLANGIYAAGAIATMMQRASEGAKATQGTRMGVWGASQAVAFGAGGFAGTMIVDVLKAAGLAPLPSYGTVFVAEAILFLVAAFIALKMPRTAQPATRNMGHDTALVELAAGRG